MPGEGHKRTPENHDESWEFELLIGIVRDKFAEAVRVQPGYLPVRMFTVDILHSETDDYLAHFRLAEPTGQPGMEDVDTLELAVPIAEPDINAPAVLQGSKHDYFVVYSAAGPAVRIDKDWAYTVAREDHARLTAALSKVMRYRVAPI